LNFVLDASVTLTWAFRDEWHSIAVRARQVLESPGGTAVVPSLWWFEVRNILIVNERRGRIDSQGTIDFLNELSNLNFITAPIGDDAALLGLARKHKLSVYDSAYLALAIEQKAPLATMDQKLREAASAVNVELLG
jgi:predicted nucleic acid-binding protein